MDTLNTDPNSNNPFDDDTDDDPFDTDEPSDPFGGDRDDGLGGGGSPSSDSKFCVACGTMTTVTNGEVKYCGNCGNELSAPIYEFDDDLGYEPEEDIDIGVEDPFGDEEDDDKFF